MGTKMRSRFFSTVLWSSKSIHQHQLTPAPRQRVILGTKDSSRGFLVPQETPNKKLPGRRGETMVHQKGSHVAYLYGNNYIFMVTNTIPTNTESMSASFSTETECGIYSFSKNRTQVAEKSMLFNFKKDTQTKSKKQTPS